MPTSVGAYFTLLVAISALPPASAIRDSFDADSALAADVDVADSLTAALAAGEIDDPPDGVPLRIISDPKWRQKILSRYPEARLVLQRAEGRHSDEAMKALRAARKLGGNSHDTSLQSTRLQPQIKARSSMHDSAINAPRGTHGNSQMATTIIDELSHARLQKDALAMTVALEKCRKAGLSPVQLQSYEHILAGWRQPATRRLRQAIKSGDLEKLREAVSQAEEEEQQGLLSPDDLLQAKTELSRMEDLTLISKGGKGGRMKRRKQEAKVRLEAAIDSNDLAKLEEEISRAKQEALVSVADMLRASDAANALASKLLSAKKLEAKRRLDEAAGGDDLDILREEISHAKDAKLVSVDDMRAAMNALARLEELAREKPEAESGVDVELEPQKRREPELRDGDRKQKARDRLEETEETQATMDRLEEPPSQPKQTPQSVHLEKPREEGAVVEARDGLKEADKQHKRPRSGTLGGGRVRATVARTEVGLALEAAQKASGGAREEELKRLRQARDKAIELGIDASEFEEASRLLREGPRRADPEPSKRRHRLSRAWPPSSSHLETQSSSRSSDEETMVQVVMESRGWQKVRHENQDRR